jgi:hypothetical protein
MGVRAIGCGVLAAISGKKRKAKTDRRTEVTHLRPGARRRRAVCAQVGRRSHTPIGRSNIAVPGD